jgi:hypothetical protein
MNCFALTGITPELIREIKQGKPRTLELQSTHNVITLAAATPGSHLFVTSIDFDDLTPGDSGIMVELLSVSISMKRMMEFSMGLHYEERERISARVQVKFCGTSSVKAVTHEGLTQPIMVEVVKSSCFHAG